VTSAIEISGLHKVYGETRALDGIDLSVPEGSVFGFLGPNGAGKTTTLRILTGLARPTSGAAAIMGRDVVGASNEVRAMVGFLPDVPGYYEWMTAPEFLRFSGGLYGLRGSQLDERVDALLDLAGLTSVSARVGGYSRGMRQRLGVAQALISAPRVLMLDEPTSALDPMGRKDVLEMIASLKGRTTVFFSTHILTDVERVCDHVAILDQGRVVRDAPIGEVRRAGGAARIAVEVTAGAAHLEPIVATAPWANAVTREGETILVSPSDIDAARRALPALVAEQGLALVRMGEDERSLEDVFVDLVGGGVS
jgi:ABC-2 type transport system ATP-binding protein